MGNTRLGRASLVAFSAAMVATAAVRIIQSEPAQSGVSYTLDRIEVSRGYRPWDFAVNPGTTMSPGQQTVSVSTRMFQLGWEIAFKSGDHMGRSHGLGQVDLTELPKTIEPGTNATFKAFMHGWWETSSFGIDRDHTISISGAAGNKSWSKVGDRNGSMEATLDTANTFMVSAGAGDELPFDINAKINFGGDNWGEMRIRLIYKCQNCARAQLSARLICKSPLILTPTSSTSVDQEVCTVCIADWIRNVSDRVQVVYPEQLDSYGRHANGVTVFAGGSDQTGIGPMGVEPSTMGGKRCPDRQTFLPVEYPWNVLLKAELNARPGPFTVPLIVRQKGAGSVSLTITGTIRSRGGLVGAGGRATMSIQTSDGHFVAAVGGGGKTGPEAMHTDATRVGEHETFEFVLLGGDEYAIRTASGNFLTAVNGGGVAAAESIRTNAVSVSAFERFTLVDAGGGFYALKTANGHYVTAVGGGGRTVDAIHTDATRVGAFEKFKIVR